MLHCRVLVLHVVLLSHEPALLQKSVDHYPVRGHHVAPRSPGTVFVEHGFSNAQAFQCPSGVCLGVGELGAGRRRVSAPLTVYRVIVEPYLVRGRLPQPVGFEHLVDVEPEFGRRVEHGLYGMQNNNM